MDFVINNKMKMINEKGERISFQEFLNGLTDNDIKNMDETYCQSPADYFMSRVKIINNDGIELSFEDFLNNYSEDELFNIEHRYGQSPEEYFLSQDRSFNNINEIINKTDEKKEKACVVCFSKKEVQLIPSNFYYKSADNHYYLCKNHAIELQHQLLINNYGEGKSIVNQYDLAKKIYELTINDSSKIDELKEYMETLIEPLATPRTYSTFSIEQVNEIKELVVEMPNFKEAIEYCAAAINATLRNKAKQNRFQPILLTGVPGIGKTRFVNKLSQILKIDYKNIQVSTMNASFQLTGSHPTWRGATIGALTKSLIDFKYQSHNGLILLDEIDKSNQNREHGSIYQPMLQILESDTSDNFCDDFIEAPIATSGLWFFATSNSLKDLPEAIIDRFYTIEVKKPTEKQVIEIIKNIYEDLTGSWKQSGYTIKPLSNGLITRLKSYSIREIKQKLNVAVLLSAEKNKNIINLDQCLLNLSKKNKRGSFGFVPNN